MGKNRVVENKKKSMGSIVDDEEKDDELNKDLGEDLDVDEFNEMMERMREK
jgi:hypothetical protein